MVINLYLMNDASLKLHPGLKQGQSGQQLSDNIWKNLFSPGQNSFNGLNSIYNNPIGFPSLMQNTLLGGQPQNNNFMFMLTNFLLQSLIGQKPEQQKIVNNNSAAPAVQSIPASRSNYVASKPVNSYVAKVNNSNQAKNTKDSAYNGAYRLLDNVLNLPEGPNVTITQGGNAEIRTHDSTNLQTVYRIEKDAQGNQIVTKKVINKKDNKSYSVDPNNSKVSYVGVYANGKIQSTKSSNHTSNYEYFDDGSVKATYRDKNGELTKHREERPSVNGYAATIQGKYENGKLISEHERLTKGSMYEGEERSNIGIKKNYKDNTTLIYKDNNNIKKGNSLIDTTQYETYNDNGNLIKLIEHESQKAPSGGTRVYKSLTREFSDDGTLTAFKNNEYKSGVRTITELKDGVVTKKVYQGSRIENGKTVDLTQQEQNNIKAEMSKKPSEESSLKKEIINSGVSKLLKKEDTAKTAKKNTPKE